MLRRRDGGSHTDPATGVTKPFAGHLFDGTLFMLGQGFLSRIAFIWGPPFWFFSPTSGGKVTVLTKEKNSNLSALEEIAVLNMLGFLKRAV